MNKPLTSWQKTLRILGYRVNWEAVPARKRRREKLRQQYHFEKLEPRKLLATVTDFNDGLLTVTGTENFDWIAFSATPQGKVVVGHAATDIDAMDVESIFVDGLGGGRHNSIVWDQ